MMDNINDILIIIAVVLVVGTIWYLLDIPIRSNADLPEDTEHPQQRKG